MDLLNKILNTTIWESEEDGIFTRKKTRYSLSGAKSQSELTQFGEAAATAGFKILGAVLDNLNERRHIADQSTPQRHQIGRYCAQCGEPASSTAAFCKDCGSSLA